MKPHIPALRDPFEVMMLVAAFAQGWVNVFTRTQAGDGTLGALLPHWFQVAWCFVMAIGATAALVGIARRNKPGAGLSLEATGLVLVATSLAIYSAAIIVVQGNHLVTKGILSAFVCLAFAVAAAWRTAQIRRLLEGTR